MYAIETENLSKSFDGLVVLRGLDLRAPTGQVYGILGPNGVGKSTLIHLLLGFLKPTRGTLRVLGERDLERTRGRVGYLPERLRYHLRYTGREYLRYLGRFNDLHEPRLGACVDEELRTVGLLDAADRLLSTYSKGMLQRLGVAQALLNDPELLLIDEPTSGLDPAGQREMLDLLAEIRGRGHTIFLTTHILSEAEQLCDTVGILFDGKLAREVDVRVLRAPGHDVVINVASLTPELVLRLQRLAPAVRCHGYEISLCPNTPALQATVLRTLLDADVAILALQPRSNPLEELYLSVVHGAPGEPPDEPPGVEAVPEASAPLPDPPDAARPARPATGDTLLRELLGREHERWQRPEQSDET
ncbi:MAG: ABC transporter ATP-binding protein [Roseiflexaceae bacterium]